MSKIQTQYFPHLSRTLASTALSNKNKKSGERSSCTRPPRLAPRTESQAPLSFPATMSRRLPLELIDKCIGSRLWVIMKG